MRDIKVGAIYKHFKGMRYVVIGLSKPTNILLGDVASVTHTELNTNIAIAGKVSYYHHEKAEKEMLVLYKELSLDPKIYARPIKMFLSEVDKSKYPQVRQKYRFEYHR